MLNRYIVTYDVSDDDRRNKVFTALRGYGDHIQYSVFRMRSIGLSKRLFHCSRSCTR